MKPFFLCVGLFSLLFCVACGTSSSSSSGSGFGGGGTSGNSTNSSLTGNFTYEIAGYDVTDGVPFREAGAFVADGNGNITSGEDDFAEGTTVTSNQMVTGTGAGTYSISSDGTGVATFNFANGGGLQVAIAVQSAPTVYLAVNIAEPAAVQLQVNGAGVAVAQTASALTAAAAPNGTFAFRMQDVGEVLGSLEGSVKVGVFTVASGAVSSGTEDQLIEGAAATELTLTGGLFNTPDALGRGMGTLTDSNSVTTPLTYYVVDSNHLHFFSTATGTIGVGRAVAQTATSFSSGSYVFGSRGDDSNLLGGVNTVGLFTAGSGGTISGGQFDSAQDGTTSSGTYTGGSYTAEPSGRVAVTLLPSTGSAIQQTYYVVSSSEAFFLTNDTTKAESGTATLQQSSTFSNSTVNGTFGFAMDGLVINSGGTEDLYDRVGYLHWDGSGNLGLDEFVNVDGSGSTSGILNGSYTVASNGRAVGNISNLSSNLVFYLVSGTQAYMLQADTGVEINGTMGVYP